MKGTRLKSKLLWLILSGFILSSTACSDDAGKEGNKKAGKKAQAKAIPVEILSPTIGKASSYYVTTATLSASSDAKINARASGVIRNIYHEEGDDVKAGDVLLLLENDDQKLRLEQAEINLASTKREFNRLNKMKKAGAVSANDWETSNTAYQNAKTSLALAKLALSYTEVAAPFDGRLVWREVDLGAYVASGDLLFRMMSIHPLLLRVHVPANRIEKITVGQTVDLTVDSIDQSLEAKVSLVSPIVDPDSGTVKVTVRLDHYPEGVRPGDFTEIRMITNSRDNALLLPTVAVIEERGQNYLFIVKDNKASRRNIKVGYALGDKTEILSGIEASDQVVVKGQRNLNEGNSLKIIDSDS
ncbi:MAG: hypothetical protein DRQ47_00250 [Gammaproteobacteria bacterium]|nr:MAG: hypothetical protein DRQ47_00250 [Gammaproteobacteria bacterium]